MLPLFFSLDRVVFPAIIVRGFAEKVPPPIYARLDFDNVDVFAYFINSSLPQITPIGNPPPTIFPRVTISGSRFILL